MCVSSRICWLLSLIIYLALITMLIVIPSDVQNEFNYIILLNLFVMLIICLEPSVIYVALIYLALSLITLIYSALGLPLSNISYIDLFKFECHSCTEFTLKLQNYDSKYHVLTISSYNPTQSFPIVH